MGESSGPSKKEHRPGNKLKGMERKGSKCGAPERWDGDTGESEHQVHPGEDGQAKEPEPQEQKHLFITGETPFQSR